MIRFTCCNSKCGNSIDKLYTKMKEVPSWLDCGQCGSKLERKLGAPSTKSTQIVDNGLQARQTEVMNEVVEKERDRLYSEE